MEARNLATAQEMISEGNYLTPTLNGELRLEKPPLPTWIAAGIERLTPDNLIVQRYAAGLSASLMALFLYLFISRLTRNRNIALAASLVSVTCYNIVIMGRTATWDIYCHSFMLGAIYFLFFAFEKTGGQWKYFILSGLFMGLSFLSKGPVSFYALLLPFLISYIIVYRPATAGKKLPLASMLTLCIIISLSWTLYILFFHPEMALHVAGKESSSWLIHNTRPWYYYWTFPAEAGIWALFLVTAIIHYFVYKKESYRKEARFAIIWFFASLILLSIIPEKKTRYLLPILIPGAMIIAFYFYHAVKNLTSKSEKYIFKANAIIIATILAAMPIALYIMFYDKKLISPFILGLTAVLCWGLSVSIFASIYGKTGIKAKNVFAAIISTMVITEGLCLIPIGHLFINEDRHSIKMLRNNEKVDGLPFYYDTNELLRTELVYEANRIIRPLDPADTVFINKHAPFVYISTQPVGHVFANQEVAVEIIDKFDNNWVKRANKRYNMDLVKEVAIIRSIKK